MKKKILCLLLACLLMFAVAACRGEQSGPAVAEDGAVKLYWNVDRDTYVGDSSAGMNSRTRGDDGFYSVRFAIRGEQVTYKVEKARLLEKIDSMDIMGLQIDDRGVITKVYDPGEITGGEVASMRYVVIASDTTITVSTDEALEKDYQFFDIAENAGIYNVTGMDPVGMADVAIPGDRIRAFVNTEGLITHVFIVERYGYWGGETVTKQCSHCNQEVNWRVWEEKNALPTDSSHWILDNKVMLSAQQKILQNREIILDLNGYTVTGPDSKRVYAMTGENAYLAILDSSESGSGKIVASGSPDNGSVIYIRYGTFELFGGTIDASQIATQQYASAVRVNTDCVFNMYGGTIIGGQVVAPEDPENAITNSGYGGTMYVSGTMNLYDGSISGGSCVKSGGNIFVGRTGTLNLYGGQIRDGYAAEKGGNIAGTGKVNVYAATVSGGKAEIYGGNFFVGNGGLLTLDDSMALVSEGTAKQGGNIYIEKGAAVKANAGTLKLGKSSAHGGSIAVYGECDLGACTVTEGNASEQGGNIFVGKAGTLHINGATVQNGTAGTKGGNIAGTGAVNLNSGTVKDGEATTYGGNMFSGEGAVVLLGGEQVTLSGGKAKQGGNAYIENGAQVTMDGGNILDGQASAHGGAVAVYGKFYVNNGLIQDNTASEQGGNLFVGKAGNLYISGGNITKGTAGTKGGNIAGTGSITLSGGTIGNGSAKQYGGNLFVSGTVKMSGGTISGGQSANGGGVVVNGATFLMTGGVIKGGTATQDGGCVYIARNVDSDGATLSVGSFTMSGGEISGGTATRYGGNVFTGKECTFTLKGGKVTGGSSEEKGGNMNLTGTVVIEGGTISGGKSKNGGNISSAGTLEIRGGTISGGTVTNSTMYDRNIFVEDGSVTLSGGTISGGVRIKKTTGAVLTGTIRIINDQKIENLTLDADMTVSIGDLAQGAAIGIHTDMTRFAVDAVAGDETYFTCDQEGFEVTYADGMLTLSTAVIDWTSTDSLPTQSGKYRLTAPVTVSAAASTAKEAQIYLDLNGFTITGTNNTRIYVLNDGTTLTITDTSGNPGKIVCVRESTADAGAFYLKGVRTVLNWENGTLDASGVRVKSGAAVYVAAGGTLKMSGGLITGGTATGNGGNIYIAAEADLFSAGVFQMSGGIIEKGTAATGGNVCALGVFQMTNGLITGGTATGNATGGNVYTTPGNKGGSFTMLGGTIEGGVRVNSSGKVTLGGTAKISGGKTNLTLSDKPATLETNGFSEGAEIFVNPEYVILAEGGQSFGVIGVAGDETYIRLDSGKEIVAVEGKLYEVKPSEPEEPTEPEPEEPTEPEVTEPEVTEPEITEPEITEPEVTEPVVTEPEENVIDWTSGNTLPTQAGSYRLTQPVTLTETANLAAEVSLDLNGFTVDANNMQAYLIQAGGILTITDSREGGKIIGASTTGNGGTIYISAGGTLNLYGGTISGGQATGGTGGNIYVQAATNTVAEAGVFHMYGGTVSGGKAKQGGNVYLAAGSDTKAAAACYLYDGTITGGEGTTTAGNVAALGVFYMENGEITEGICNVTGDHKYASNIYTLPGKNGCTFTMLGGTIEGGVRVNNAGAIILGGTARIAGGTTNLTFSKGTMETTGFSEGAEIWVNRTTYGVKNSFGIIGVAGDEQYVRADNGSTVAVSNDGKLYLVQETKLFKIIIKRKDNYK